MLFSVSSSICPLFSILASSLFLNTYALYLSSSHFFFILAHLLCETLVGPDPESPSDTVGPNNNNHVHLCSNTTKGSVDNPEQDLVKTQQDLFRQTPPSITISNKPARLSLERSFSAEEDKLKCVECTLQPARVYTITSRHGMLMSGGRGSKESLELDVLKEKSGSGGLGSKGGSVGGGGSHTTLIQPSTSPSSTSSSPTQYSHTSRGTSSLGGSHHHSNHHHGNHHRPNAPSSSGGGSGASGGSSSNQQQQALSVAGSHSHHGSHHHSHHHHHLSQPPLQTSVSAHNIRGWGEGGKGEAECSGLACDSCSGAPSRSQGSLDLESASREPGKQHRRLERMWSVDRVTGLERGERVEDAQEGRGTEIQMRLEGGLGLLIRPCGWD